MSSKTPVNVDLSAKLEAKLNIEATIPEKASGRIVNAISDYFSPWTESRGLKGDQIRLQRQDTLLKIAKIVRDREIFETTPLHQFPPKIMVPLLEKASLENPESEAIEWWANIISAGLANTASQQISFVEFMSKISTLEAKILEYLWNESTDAKVFYSHEFQFNFANAVQSHMLEYIAKNSSDPNWREYRNSLIREALKLHMTNFVNQCSIFGYFVVEASIPSVQFFARYWTNRKLNLTGVTEIDIIDSLKTIGVLREEQYLLDLKLDRFNADNVALSVIRFSEMGLKFMEICKPRTSGIG